MYARDRLILFIAGFRFNDYHTILYVLLPLYIYYKIIIFNIDIFLFSFEVFVCIMRFPFFFPMQFNTHSNGFLFYLGRDRIHFKNCFSGCNSHLAQQTPFSREVNDSNFARHSMIYASPHRNNFNFANKLHAFYNFSFMVRFRAQIIYISSFGLKYLLVRFCSRHFRQ